VVYKRRENRIYQKNRENDKEKIFTIGINKRRFVFHSHSLSLWLIIGSFNIDLDTKLLFKLPDPGLKLEILFLKR